MEIKKDKFYIVRAKDAGVFFGKIAEKGDHEVTMTEVRKMWYWDGACAVEQLAEEGTTNPTGCKLTVMVSEMVIADPIQIIPCTDRAYESLAKVGVWKR